MKHYLYFLRVESSPYPYHIFRKKVHFTGLYHDILFHVNILYILPWLYIFYVQYNIELNFTLFTLL